MAAFNLKTLKDALEKCFGDGEKQSIQSIRKACREELKLLQNLTYSLDKPHLLMAMSSQLINLIKALNLACNELPRVLLPRKRKQLKKWNQMTGTKSKSEGEVKQEMAETVPFDGIGDDDNDFVALHRMSMQQISKENIQGNGHVPVAEMSNNPADENEGLVVPSGQSLPADWKELYVGARKRGESEAGTETNENHQKEHNCKKMKSSTFNSCPTSKLHMKSCNPNSIWKLYLQLKYKDRQDIVTEKRLSSDHIEAINIMLRKQYGLKINGFQLPIKMPTFDDQNKRWILSNVMHPVNAPACQIHHTHNDHWVVSFLDSNKNLFLFDSLGNARHEDSIIPDGLKIQLSLLYGRGQKELIVIVPDSQKQVGGLDCGLFAIANAVSFCSSGMIDTNIVFYSNMMRSHLHNCFEKEYLTVFPLDSELMRSIFIKQQKYDKVIKISNYCYCSLPACVDEMIPCGKCAKMFHKQCCKLPTDVVLAEFIFRCAECKNIQ